jgi:ankyrin repeat protein
MYDYYNYTILLVAIINKNLPIIEDLIARGAKVNMHSFNSESGSYYPLQKAIELNCDEIVKYLLEHDADPTDLILSKPSNKYINYITYAKTFTENYKNNTNALKRNENIINLLNKFKNKK